MQLTRNTVSFLNVRVDALDTRGLCDRIIQLAYGDRTRKVMYVNAHCMLIARDDEQYRRVLNRADLVYADGVGVVWGARLWGHELPGRSTGADFMPRFCEVFAKYGLRVYLLGAQPGVAEEAAARLRERIPDLQIVGVQHGYFRRDRSEEIIGRINASEPHILLVGMGAPYQEVWIDEYCDQLKVPVVWGVGGLFDFLSGRTARGPQWLLDNGFEWFCRLIVEPRRLWRRYLLGNTEFVLYLLWRRYILDEKG